MPQTSKLIAAINSGKKVKGLTGFIEAQFISCCNTGKGETFYVPVTVVRLISEDCDTMHVEVSVDRQTTGLEFPQVVRNETPFTMKVSPSKFYDDLESVYAKIAAIEVAEAYKRDIRRLTQGWGRASHRTNIMAVLEHAPADLKAAIEAEKTDAGTSVSKLQYHFLEKLAKETIKRKHYPKLAIDEEPEDLDY